MATGGPSTAKGKEEDFRHTCSLCMEPYRGRCPKILPCYHTFCLPCLTALEASVRSAKSDTPSDEALEQKEAEKQQLSQAKSDDVEGEIRPRERPDEAGQPNVSSTGNDNVTVNQDDIDKTVFLCPFCRALVTIPEGGVASLQTNFYVDNDLDPDEPLSTSLCDMCEGENRQPATHACPECQLNMCRTCRRCHDIMARDHHVKSVGLGQPAKEKREKKGFCLVHQDQTLCFYCPQCDVTICTSCKLTSHDGHETVNLASAAQQARQEILSLIPTAQQQLQVMEMSLQQVDREGRELTRHAQEVMQQIHAHYDVLMTSTKQTCEQLVEEASAKEASTRNQLAAEKSSIMLTQGTLSTLLSRAVGASAGDPDVVMLRKELKMALLTDHQLDQHKERVERQDRSWSWNYDISGVLHEDDVKASLGRVVEGADAEVSRVPMPPRELSGRMDRWVKEMTDSTLASKLTSCTDSLTSLQKTGEDQKKKQDEQEQREMQLEKKVQDLWKTGEDLKKKEEELEKKTKCLEDEIIAFRKTKADLQQKRKDKLLFYATNIRVRSGEPTMFFSGATFRKHTKFYYKRPRFDSVLVNEGDHFNTYTGFSAPHAGVYVFTATMADKQEGKSYPSYALINVDSKTLCVIGDDSQGRSGRVEVSLTAGQTVMMELAKFENCEWSWVSFSGTEVLTTE